MFFLAPEITWVFFENRQQSNARTGQKKTCLFGNARPKSNARAHLKQRKKHRGLRVVNDSCCKVTFQCEDITTVAQLIQPKDKLVTVHRKNRFHHIKIHSLYCPQEQFDNINYKSH